MPAWNFIFTTQSDSYQKNISIQYRKTLFLLPKTKKKNTFFFIFNFVLFNYYTINFHSLNKNICIHTFISYFTSLVPHSNLILSDRFLSFSLIFSPIVLPAKEFLFAFAVASSHSSDNLRLLPAFSCSTFVWCVIHYHSHSTFFNSFTDHFYQNQLIFSFFHLKCRNSVFL